MIRFYTPEEYAQEKEHRRIAKEMDRLERFSFKVGLSFIAGGIIYAIVWGLVIASFIR